MSRTPIAIWGCNETAEKIVNQIIKDGKERVSGIIKEDYKVELGVIGSLIGDEIKEIDISDNLQRVLKDSEVVIICDHSGIEQLYPKIKAVIENKVNCIVISEDMTYPFYEHREISEEIHKLAKENESTVLGMGLNSGFALDAMIITLASSCRNIQSLEARRVNDLSIYDDHVLRANGVGMSEEEFDEELNEGNIQGHLGFAQSLQLVCKALNISIEKVEEEIYSIISNTCREIRDIKVKPGDVCGCTHIIRGIRDGKNIITLEHTQELFPQCEALEIGDYIDIKGESGISMWIKPENYNGFNTASLALNMINRVILSEPGLKSMIDFTTPYITRRSYEENQERVVDIVS